MILITGATGNVGRQAALGLANSGKRVRALVRDPRKAGLLLHRRIETRHGDFDDVESLVGAFQGVDAALLLVPFGRHQERWTQNLVEAARAGGVPRVVFLSVLGAGHAEARIAAWAEACEKIVADGGFSTTHLRPAMYAQSLLIAAADAASGSLDVPLGRSPIAYVDADDVAEAVQTVLTTDGHDGAVYRLTGPEAVAPEDVAQRLSVVLGRRVQYHDLPPDQAAELFCDAGLARADAEAYVELLQEHFGSGCAAEVHPDLERLLGRPPEGLDTVLVRQRKVLQEHATRGLRRGTV